jgi:hypothetical protein
VLTRLNPLGALIDYTSLKNNYFNAQYNLLKLIEYCMLPFIWTKKFESKFIYMPQWEAASFVTREEQMQDVNNYFKCLQI